MYVKVSAKNYYKRLWNLPPSNHDLAEFAELILNEFIAELENNTTNVVWNYGFDTVIFKSKSKDGMKPLDQIKKEFLDDRSDAVHTIDSLGARTNRCEPRDETVRGSD